MGRAARIVHHRCSVTPTMERSMSKPVDLSKSLAALDQDSTSIVVIEMSPSSRLVAARARAWCGIR